MKKMTTITQSDINKKVIYIPFEGCSINLYEEGIITSFKNTSSGNINIFVRYGMDVNSKATSIESLWYK
jgi:hypothetical protein